MLTLSELGAEIGLLCEEKNEAYGDSFAKAGFILESLYPDGVKPEQYTDMLGVIRIIDKLFRIATRKNAFGESPWRDIAGYGILGVYADQENSELGAVPEPEDTADVFNRLMRTVTQPVLVEEPPEERCCMDCCYSCVPLDEYPCKKCNEKPYLPHFVKS